RRRRALRPGAVVEAQTVARPVDLAGRNARGEEREARKGQGGTRRRPHGSGLDLNGIVLDDRVGEEPLAGPAEPLAGRGLALGGALDVEVLALAHAVDALDAERAQRPFDRLALGVEDAGLQGHDDARSHRLDLSRKCRADLAHAAAPFNPRPPWRGDAPPPAC